MMGDFEIERRLGMFTMGDFWLTWTILVNRLEAPYFCPYVGPLRLGRSQILPYFYTSNEYVSSWVTPGNPRDIS